MIAFDSCRFVQGPSSEISGYVEVRDFIQNKSYLGRWLPQVDPVRKNLEFWTGLRHPAFLFIPRYWTKDGKYMVLLEDLNGSKRLRDLNPQSLSAEQVAAAFARLLNAFAFLDAYQLALPRLDLGRLYFHPERGLKITGHETACRVEGVFADPEMVHFDMRYSPPEWVDTDTAHERSGVYYAAALFYHFLTRRLHQPGTSYLPVTQTFRRLKRGWDDLLSGMLADDPERRPSFGQACQACLKLISPHARTPIKREMIAFLPVEDAQSTKLLTGALLASEMSPTAAMLETCPGVELVRRLSRLVALAHSRHYLVLHVWNATRSGLPFKTVNDLIRQLAEKMLPDLGLDELAAECLPLSEWQDSEALRRKWPLLISRIIEELSGKGIQGVLVIVEDVQNLDAASQAALVEAAHMLRSRPVMFAFTCDTLTSPECSFLREHWPWRQVVVGSMSDARTRLADCVWSPARDGEFSTRVREDLAATGGNEVLFLRRMHPFHPLRGREYQAFLRRIWENLSAKEQLVVKLLICSFRPLTRDEMERAFGVRHLEHSVSRLREFSIIMSAARDSSTLAIRNTAIGAFCEANLGQDEKQHMWRQLLAFEMSRPDSNPMQLIFLALKTSRVDLADEHIAAQTHLLAEAWDRQAIRAMADVHARTKSAKLKPFWVWANLLADVALDVRGKQSASLFRKWSGCVKKSARGDFRGAAEGYFKLAALRSNSRAQRGFFLFKSAQNGVELEDPIWVGKCWRSFERLDLSAVSVDAREEWLARFAAFLTVIDHASAMEQIDVAALPAAWRAWSDAHRAYLRSAFGACVAHLECALPQVREVGDANWTGQALKMYGNALYRSNRPEKAIAAYHEAAEYYRCSKNRIGLDNLDFNLATSEKLAGRLVHAMTSFPPVLKRAEERGDDVTRCQIFYNLSVIALMQFDDVHYREISTQHLALAQRLHLAEEQVRGLSLRLHGALMWSKAEVVDLIVDLEKALKKGPVDALLADEADVALRLAYFVVGKRRESAEGVEYRFTQWRRRFIDFLQGNENESFASIFSDLGSGLFRCYHLLWIKNAVEAGLVPRPLLTQEVADAYVTAARSAGARVAPFLKVHLSHLKTMGDVPRSNWERAIEFLESVHWWEVDAGSMTAEVVAELRHIWSFDRFGFLVRKRGSWVPLDPDDSDSRGGHDVRNSIKLLDVRLEEGPVTTTLWSGTGSGALHLLALPFRAKPEKRAVFWATRDASEAEVPPSFLEPLYRFYGKLLEYAVGLGSDDVPADARTRPPGSLARWGIVGQSNALAGVLEQIALVGPTDLNVFISGASGTGKELVARALHEASARARKPFRAVNCSHFPETLIESELFGHVRGSFTGATSDRIGFLEMADGGTLFLDEIGDLHPKTQSALLRVIQEGEFSRVGESRVRRVNLRIITATNKDLQALIDRELFRRDLFFRIAEEKLQLPPLHERMDDLPLLAEHFAKKHFAHRSVSFCPAFFDPLRHYAWPGNVREFESYVRRVMSRCPDVDSITGEHILPFLMDEGELMPEDEPSLEESERRHRRKILQKRLAQYSGNRTQTARSLGISRQRLIILLKQFRLD